MRPGRDGARIESGGAVSAPSVPPRSTGPAFPVPRGRREFVLLALAVLGSLSVLANGFTLDAQFDLSGNAYVTEPGRLGQLLGSDYLAGSGLRSGFWRPAVGLVNWLLWRAGDGAPWPFLALNLALHAAIVLGLFHLGREFGLCPTAALIGAGLFAVHPLRVEVVGGVVGLKDLLAVAGLLSALLAFLAARRENGRGRGLSLDLLGGVAFLIALLAKESALALIPTLALLDAYRLRTGERPPRGTVGREYALLAGAVAVKFGGAWLLLGDSLDVAIHPTDNPLALLGPLSGRIRALGLIAWNAGRFLWPARQSPDYSYDAIPIEAAWFQGAIAVGALLAIGWIALLLMSWRREWAAPFAVLALLGAAYLPISNLATLGGTIAADRFLYLPSAAASLAVGWLLTRPLVPRRVGQGSAILLMIAGLVASNIYILDWRDDYRLWTGALRARPESLKVVYGAVFEMGARGEADRALAVVDEALARRDPSAVTRALKEEWEPALNQLRGRLLIDLGRREEGLAALAEAVRRAPERSDWAIELARIESRLGRYEAAVATYAGVAASTAATPEQRAIAASERTQILGPLSDQLLREGRRRDALQVLRDLLTDDPQSVAARGNYALLLAEDGRAAEAEPIARALAAEREFDARAQLILATVLDAAGKREEARSALERIVIRFPEGDPARDEARRRIGPP